MNDPLKKSKRCKADPGIEYQVACLEEEEIQQKLDIAFNLLFEEVLRRREKVDEKLSTSKKRHYVQLGI